MQKLGLNDIRERFLLFFEGKGHLRLGSFSLVPENDASLLLINSGMAPLKPYFTGAALPPRRRAATCQKCIRTPDIERVGKTARHGTFFEMLGNFSFGDYFKKEAIEWAWEFVIQDLRLPAEKLHVSIYMDDDEAFNIWRDNIGLPTERIVRLGKEDNFWEHGLGPCGPCSEIYFDRGEAFGCGSDSCAVGCDCDRYIEFWNLVFTQFNKSSDGSYSRLASPNIDTGMGLERLACIMQDVDNMFEVDTIRRIIETVCDLASVKYHEDSETDVSVRVITDHIRSTVMMASDMILPSNEGRGYVLRRLLRRAARHGRLLGVKGNFLDALSQTVVEESGLAYPELVEKREYIRKVLSSEEERFSATLDQGLIILNEYLDELKATGRSTIDGDMAFKLYDTYGFPLDLTREIADEAGLVIDETGYSNNMNLQREKARGAIKGKNSEAWSAKIKSAVEITEGTEFTGYCETKSDATVLGIILDDRAVDVAGEGETVVIILDRTPFYAESGGQVSDIGEIRTANAGIEVFSCVKTEIERSAAGAGGERNGDGAGGGHGAVGYGQSSDSGQDGDANRVSGDGAGGGHSGAGDGGGHGGGSVYLHHCEVKTGSISKGDAVMAAIDASRRFDIAKNHTATHLLQRALVQTLGSHVHQAGSLVASDRLRFDFTHFEQISHDTLKKIEEIVNEKILENLRVGAVEMNVDDAKKTGATALFGEKYGDVVRVVSVGDFSKELCGGTHVGSTLDIGMLTILSEGGISAGTRRIEAITGREAIERHRGNGAILAAASAELKTVPEDLVKRIDAILAEIKEKDRELSSIKEKMIAGSVDGIVAKAVDVEGVQLIIERQDHLDMEALRNLADNIKSRENACVVVLASGKDGKVSLVAAAAPGALAKGVHSGNIIREVAKITGGGGGGRPDMAQAGGKNVGMIDKALEAVPDLLTRQINQVV